MSAADQKKKNEKKEKENYNVKQSKIAIGSGGFFGKGFLKGTQTQGDFVPEQHTDFIFTSVGESFGFWGSALLMLLYLGLLLRIIAVAERQRSTFSRVYAYSVAAIIFFHVSINICMTIGLAPVIGITLPLMSYGGSSLLTFTILIFILIKLDADRQMVLR
jgi:rod shape determining protein RodA